MYVWVIFGGVFCLFFVVIVGKFCWCFWIIFCGVYELFLELVGFFFVFLGDVVW